MAQSGESKKRPRIRKTAPTVREIVETQSAKAEAPRGRRRSVTLRAVKWPFAWIASSNNVLARAIRLILRPIGKILRKLIPSYFVNSWRELKQVTWPGRLETWRLTAAVFMFAIVFGVLIYSVDLALDKLFRVTVLR